MKSETVIRNAVLGLLALGVAAASAPALAAKGDNEKCAGIAKAGKNDCGTSTSSCAATATKDRDPEAWIYVPKGTCEKVVGGTITNKSYNVHGGAAALKK